MQPTNNNTFIHSCLGGVQGIFNTKLLFLKLSFGLSTDLDDGNTTRETRRTLVEPFLLVVRLGNLSETVDLLTRGNFTTTTSTNNGTRFLAELNARRVTEDFDAALVGSASSSFTPVRR